MFSGGSCRESNEGAEASQSTGANTSHSSEISEPNKAVVFAES